MSKWNRASSRKRHNFLNDAFFKDDTGNYAVNDSVSGWVLVKHINGNTGDHEVAIYTEDAYKRYREYSNKPNSLFGDPS